MRTKFFSVSALMLAAGVSHAGDLGINVILSGQVAPGIYGQVQLGNAPPPIVYAQPMLIEPQPYELPPVYLHVPPGHASHWREHCREYHACNRRVYFVRSAEYEPGYGRAGHDGDREHHDEGDREREHHEERDREHHEEQDRDREHHDRGRDHEHGDDRDRDRHEDR